MTACLVVSDEVVVADAVAGALAALDVPVLGVGPWGPFDEAATALPSTFDEAEDMMRRADATSSVSAVVVVTALPPDATVRGAAPWAGVLDRSAPTTEHVVAHAAWARATARHGARTGRPVRIVHVTAGGSTGETGVAQAVAQLARSAQDSPNAVDLHAFAVSLESPDAVDLGPLADLVARLVWAEDGLGVAGAELVVSRGWLGIRRHPRPAATISYGGPSLPDWVDLALREITGAQPSHG